DKSGDLGRSAIREPTEENVIDMPKCFCIVYDRDFVDVFDFGVAVDGHQTVDGIAFGIDKINKLEGGRCHCDGCLGIRCEEIEVLSVRISGDLDRLSSAIRVAVACRGRLFLPWPDPTIWDGRRPH